MKINLNGILEYIFVFFTIISCNSVYMNFLDSYINRFIIVSYCIVVIMLIFLKKVTYNNIKKFVLFLLVYLVYIGIFYIFNNITIFGFEFFSYFFVLFPLIFLFFINESKEDIIRLLKKFKDVIIIIAIISLIFYSLVNLKIITKFNYSPVNWSIKVNVPNVSNIYYITQNLRRNSMFFVEPAIYSIFIVLGLALEMAYDKKRINIIILLVTIISIQSTTGFLLSIIVLLINFIKKHDFKKFLIFIIIGIVIASSLSIGILNKKSDSLSFRIRKDDYITCYKAWKTNPLFGVGFMNNSELKLYISDFRWWNPGLSNGLFVVIAQGGLYLFIFYLISIVSLLKHTKRTPYFLPILLFFILSCTNMFHYTIIMFNVLALGYKIILDRKKLIYK